MTYSLLYRLSTTIPPYTTRPLSSLVQTSSLFLLSFISLHTLNIIFLHFTPPNIKGYIIHFVTQHFTFYFWNTFQGLGLSSLSNCNYFMWFSRFPFCFYMFSYLHFSRRVNKSNILFTLNILISFLCGGTKFYVSFDGK